MVYVKNYLPPNINIDEIYRYLRIPKDINDFSLKNQIEDCVKEVKDHLTYKVCYQRYNVKLSEDKIDLGFCKAKSESLRKHLKDCDEIVLFACTIGIYIDRLIHKYGVLSPLKATVFQAIGAERAESLCDVFTDDIREEEEKKGRRLLPRFSPGYGDFSIDYQKDIFTHLDCARKIGLSLNESLLMSPSKSVTAVIGIKNKGEDAIIDKCGNKCSMCNNIDCVYRLI